MAQQVGDLDGHGGLGSGLLAGRVAGISLDISVAGLALVAPATFP